MPADSGRACVSDAGKANQVNRRGAAEALGTGVHLRVQVSSTIRILSFCQLTDRWLDGWIVWWLGCLNGRVEG